MKDSLYLLAYWMRRLLARIWICRWLTANTRPPRPPLSGWSSSGAGVRSLFVKQRHLPAQRSLGGLAGPKGTSEAVGALLHQVCAVTRSFHLTYSRWQESPGRLACRATTAYRTSMVCYRAWLSRCAFLVNESANGGCNVVAFSSDGLRFKVDR